MGTSLTICMRLSFAWTPSMVAACPATSTCSSSGTRGSSDRFAPVVGDVPPCLSLPRAHWRHHVLDYECTIVFSSTSLFGEHGVCDFRLCPGTCRRLFLLHILEVLDEDLNISSDVGAPMTNVELNGCHLPPPSYLHLKSCTRHPWRTSRGP